MDNKNYYGDVNYVHGGHFLADDWKQQYKDGYVNITRIIDLDCGCGFDNALLIEKITVLVDDEDILKSALECCGYTKKDLGHGNSDWHKILTIESMMNYGHYDSVADYQNPSQVILLTNEDDIDHDETIDDYNERWTYDGWTADDCIKGESNEEIYNWLNGNGWIL